MSANVKGGPTPTMTTPLRGGYPRHPGGARELLDHVADIANILAHQNAQRSSPNPPLPSPKPELEPDGCYDSLTDRPSISGHCCSLLTSAPILLRIDQRTLI